MGLYQALISSLPEVKGPTQKRLSFKEKLKWTSITLILFFVLGMVPLFGLDPQYQFRFEQLAIILGAKFGSIISLGIGPIVTASIVLQLLNGSGLLKFDLTSSEGKKTFQGSQKLLAIFFVIFEAGIYVFMGGLSPDARLTGSSFLIMQLILIFQLFLGGLLILFMDEVVSKWGFGSGISLFIVAGVAQSVFVQAFSPLNQQGVWSFGSGQAPIGQVWGLFYHLAHNNAQDAGLAFAAIVSTILVFAMAVYVQAMKIEIPLSFGRVRGYGMRWPLKFIYTSNIPVILVAALMANIQLWARLLQNWGFPILGSFDIYNKPVSGFAAWVNSPNLIYSIITREFTFFPWGQGIMYAFNNSVFLHSLVYIVFMVVGAVLFSIFWVQTSGMDARSQADQIMSSGLSIPGFRRDPRILESILKRYIGPLTVMGAVAVGFLAASADLTGALSRGTGILLSVMIVYKMYEDIAKQHMMDMHPMMRRFME